MHLKDAISRFNTHDNNDARSKAKPIADFNISIHEVVHITGFKSITMKQIANKTASDVQLMQLKDCIVDGFPKSKYECTELTHDFYEYRESLSIINGVVLKDKRIVIPTSLPTDALSTLHRSDMGIVKTKERASTCMFWPRMHSDIEKFLSTCRECMMHKIKQSPEPLECDVPSSPWSSLTLNNFEYKGTLYLIIYDRFSRFIVVKTPKDLSARSTIMCLFEVFCEHGVPSFSYSDSGRNFVSKDFNQFCQDFGIQLNFSSGYHHSVNQAKRAVHTVKDLMKCCFSASVHWKLVLLEYLCTPGPNGKSPSELLYRQFRGIMPMLSDSSGCVSDAKKLAERRKEEKEKFDPRHQPQLKPLVMAVQFFT